MNTTSDRSRRVRRLAQIAEAKTRQSAVREAGHRQQFEEAAARLAQLRRYREEYAARAATPGAWQGRDLEEFRRFLDRLDRAISEQDALVRQAASLSARSAEDVRESWRAARAIDLLGERVDATRREVEARAEQRDNDDDATRTRSNDTGAAIA